MSDKTLPISVTIANKEYNIACPSDQKDSLISSAKEVDLKMREMSSKGKVQSAERIAVMTALNLAHELLQSQRQLHAIDSGVTTHIDELKVSVDAALKALNE